MYNLLKIYFESRFFFISLRSNKLAWNGCHFEHTHTHICVTHPMWQCIATQSPLKIKLKYLNIYKTKRYQKQLEMKTKRSFILFFGLWKSKIICHIWSSSSSFVIPRTISIGVVANKSNWYAVFHLEEEKNFSQRSFQSSKNHLHLKYLYLYTISID